MTDNNRRNHLTTTRNIECLYRNTLNNIKKDSKCHAACRKILRKYENRILQHLMRKDNLCCLIANVLGDDLLICYDVADELKLQAKNLRLRCETMQNKNTYSIALSNVNFGITSRRNPKYKETNCDFDHGKYQMEWNSMPGKVGTLKVRFRDSVDTPDVYLHGFMSGTHQMEEVVLIIVDAGPWNTDITYFGAGGGYIYGQVKTKSWGKCYINSKTNFLEYERYENPEVIKLNKLVNEQKHRISGLERENYTLRKQLREEKNKNSLKDQQIMEIRGQKDKEIRLREQKDKEIMELKLQLQNSTSKSSDNSAEILALNVQVKKLKLQLKNTINNNGVSTGMYTVVEDDIFNIEDNM